MENKKFNQNINKNLQVLFLLKFVVLVTCVLINACHYFPSQTQTNTAQKMLQGFVVETDPLANASVKLIDADGQIRVAATDAKGRYRLPLDNIKAPFLLSATTGNEKDCVRNDILRPICLTSFVESVSTQKIQIANINPLTDRLVSDLAVAKGFIGPQQWVNSGKIGEYQHQWFEQALANQHSGFADAFKTLNLLQQNSQFNPVTYKPDQHKKLLNLFSLLHHNRNYDNNTGETGHATLSDAGFRPLVGLFATGAYEKFDLQLARISAKKISHAKRRIFIVGDSTSAMYEQLRFPRQGWGQALAEIYASRDDVAIVVGSRAGRSSRDFYNGRWFAQMEPFIQPGDFVLIAHGHNDQNCDAAKPVRGLADVRNLCTYPDTDKGEAQFPVGRQELSFQKSLENYIKIAREKSAFPILVTPTTRIKNSGGLQQTPVVHSHFTRQKSGSEFLFIGDYTATIKNTALKNRIPLIDLEAASINFANQAGEPGWKNYWLVIDPAINPFYANNMAGSLQVPDGAHFQAAGAQAMAKILTELINEHPELKDIQSYLN